jgi:hypothetical protein
MLTLIAPEHGAGAHNIPLHHVERHPGSLLASMCEQLQPEESGDVTLDLSAALGDSPLASWPAAPAITASIYKCVCAVLFVCGGCVSQHCRLSRSTAAALPCTRRRRPVATPPPPAPPSTTTKDTRGHIEARLLAEQLQSHTHDALVDRLEQLLDFLGLEDDLATCMPPVGSLSLRQMAVKQLGVAVLARAAVANMLDARPLFDSKLSGAMGYILPNVALFVVCVSTVQDLLVYQVPRSQLLQGQEAALRGSGKEVAFEWKGRQCETVRGSLHHPLNKLASCTLVGQEHPEVGPALCAALTAGLRQLSLPAGGAQGGKARWEQVAACVGDSSTKKFPLWVVH